jgi:hypothetical protein
MRISFDRSATEQSKIPQSRVELRNAGEKDLLLNLGARSHDGRSQYLTAVSLILHNTEGRPQWLELARTVPAGDATEALSLALPAGSTLSFPVALNDYRVTTSQDSDRRLKPGTYLIVAHLNGFVKTDQRVAILGVQALGQPPTVATRAFDSVNPESELGPPPISNAIKIELPSR